MNYNKDYFENYNSVSEYRSAYPDENIVRFLVANFPANTRKGKNILDLGCGTGRHLILLNRLGFEAYGIEGSSVGAQACDEWLKKENMSADVKVGLLKDLPYENDYFDGIIENSALVNNSWEDILLACQECHRVMKRGAVGYFLLKKPNDCAFDHAKDLGENTYLVDENIYISTKHRQENESIIFHSFSRDDVEQMFSDFATVKIHSWETSFKSLYIDDTPGERLTSYWVVLVRK